MSSSEYPPQGGVCDKCGMRTHTDAESNTACDGCGQSTEHCSCEGQRA